jgi:monooxygenase
MANSIQHFDVLIIGAGISGISAAYFVQDKCPNKTYTILEGRSNLGGTWDFFKYPGLRSDSDMYTMGFKFNPWLNAKAISSGESILEYLNETVDKFDIRKHIKFEQRVKNASWSSENNLWTLTVQQSAAETVTYTCNFLSLCIGYYDYEKAYTPEFVGRENFKGQVVHPQYWTKDIDYTNKKVIVIGSGATAMTIMPAMAEKVESITMVQRSPTYIVTDTDEDKLALLLNKILPAKLAYKLTRWKKVLHFNFLYWMARNKPELAKKDMLSGIAKELGKGYDIDKHFRPKYQPWDQRVCFVPNGDFFTAMKNNKAFVETDTIETFTEKGLRLSSGKELEADLIVTATGLSMKFFGGITFEVDGEVIDFTKRVAYKSAMFNSIPNLTMSYGYTNASWTLKCDLTSEFNTRLLKHMDAKGFKKCMPVQNDKSLVLHDWFDFSSSFIQRVIKDLPKRGDKAPWRTKQWYLSDYTTIKYSKLEDGVMEFS